MAEVTSPPDGLKPATVFTVSGRVGFGLRNSRPDVLLVQHIINQLIDLLGLKDLGRRIDVPDPLGIPHFQALEPLVVDGKVGNKTAGAIASYQANASSRHGVTRDNAIDPVPLVGGDPASAGRVAAFQSYRRRTIYCMNLDFFKSKGVILDENLFPPEVRADIIRRERRAI